MIEGKNIIGLALSAENKNTVNAINPATGEIIPGNFHVASQAEIDMAMRKAKEAFSTYSRKTGVEKARFLETIGEEIVALGDELIHRAMEETGLPEARLVGERGRTVGQLNLFASHIREGSWVNASIDTAIPDRAPLPKPDIRKMLVPVGPVVVFTASNFPLAFSTAGGDTASALAGGNPVIVKAHESHPGTNELVAKAIQTAARKCDMPDGVFSSLNGQGYELGKQLVLHPEVKSVAFTGSLRGGKALHELATQRETPIPVFAEMGSTNPVVILPGKLQAENDALAASYAGSITLGVGQFCTNPGLVLGIAGEPLEKFISSLGDEIAKIAPATMLNKGINTNYYQQLEKTLAVAGVKIAGSADKSDNKGSALVASVEGNIFLKNPSLHEEVFGPFSLVVKCTDKEELKAVLIALSGQLTTTVMCNDADLNNFAEVIGAMEQVAGRLIFNGVPTGVEVCHSMQHGGPYPATTDGRFTSVGTDAILRFVRPLSFQSAPGAFLPDELKDSNPLGIWRKVNGIMTQ